MKKKLFLIPGIILIAVMAYGVWYFMNYSGYRPVTPLATEKPLDKNKYYKLGLTPEVVNSVFEKIDSLKKDIERAPDYYPKLLELGNMYKFLAEYEMAKAEYEKAIKAWPEEATGYYNLGDLYVLNLKDPAKGLENYLLALQKQPSNSDVYRSIADLYRSVMPDKVHLIEAMMLEGVKNSPEKKAGFYEYLESFYWQEKNYEKALRYNQMLLAIDPQNQKYLSDKELIGADQKRAGNE